ncbi:MAG: 2-oxo acid dehydrogenase subunit E2, partial [Bdellovibrionales bacterium]|nr:2-oxo acid dehydrogenase subunit E2 [Bdellovibrionales bacterium]
EIDVTNIARWRKKVQNDFVKREGYKLSFTPFFLEAAVKGLVHNPYINASIDGDKILLKRDINLGCAVALPAPPGKAGGLIVPVIKRADQLSLAGIARSLNDLATRARDKALLPDEIAGGTFTVTNVGTFGNIIGNPIINQPQLAILAIGAIKKRPAVVDDMIAIRDIVYLTLSYDHRLIDGMMAGQFLKFVTDYLQNWDMNRAPF